MNIKEIQIKFIERLKGYMHEKNLTITALAEQSYIPRSTINNWILCTRSPQIDSLCKLADFFGCSVDYLLGRED